MKRHAILLITLMAVLAAGCVSLSHKPLDKHYYQINADRTGDAVQASKGTVLKVRRLTVSELYNTRELVYREPKGRVESDFYNMFFVPPGDMLTTELRTWLRSSGLFSHIIEPGSMVVPGLTLEGVVNSLYGDYTSNSPTAVVEMQFFVVDESTSNNDIVFSSTYTRRTPMAKPDPTALVQAMTEGVRTIFTELENDLADAPLTK